MNSLSKIFDSYAAFEDEVGIYITRICEKHYADCEGACCRAEICKESLTSPFLRRLRKRFASDAEYSDRRGWLVETGCALSVGRPPVCYQFFCDAIFDDRPTAEFRYAIMVLSNLVNHVGKKALGRKHIVELQESSELKRINFVRFERQLNEAKNAFKRVRAYLDGDVTKLDSLRILKKIYSPPKAKLLAISFANKKPSP